MKQNENDDNEIIMKNYFENKYKIDNEIILY